MVYDERNNFVGDTHWKGVSFDEGEELQLERGGVLIEVQEMKGQRSQDLTELLLKPLQEKEERNAARIANAPPTRLPSSLARPQVSTLVGGQTGPKALDSVIGTPSRHYGRAAMSNLSPFEQRQHPVNQDVVTEERPTKRQKRSEPPSKSGYAQSLMGSTLNLNSQRPASSASIRYEPLKVTIYRSQVHTVDLTRIDDAEEKRPAGRSPARLLKRNIHKSPPARSGYASSLTGASLSLGAPTTYVSKNSRSPIPAFPKRSTKTPLPEEDCSSSATEESTTPNNPVATISERPTTKSIPAVHITTRLLKIKTAHRSRSTSPATTTRKQSGSLKPKPETTTSKPQSHSSPSPQRPRAEPLLKPAFSNRKEPQILLDQPAGILRIKPRPKRQMMMLMDIPASRPSGSRSPAPSESSVESIYGEGNGKAASEPQIASYPEAEPLPLQLWSSPSPIDREFDHRTTDTLLDQIQPSVTGRGPYDSSPDRPSNHEVIDLVNIDKSARTGSPTESASLAAIEDIAQKEIFSRVRSQRGGLESKNTSLQHMQPKFEGLQHFIRRRTEDSESPPSSCIDFQNSDAKSIEAATNVSPKTTPDLIKTINNTPLGNIPKLAYSSALHTLAYATLDQKDRLDPIQKKVASDIPGTTIAASEATKSVNTKLIEQVQNSELLKQDPPAQEDSIFCPPRARLINPATRGPSIANAANKTMNHLAIDNLAPGSNEARAQIMGPPRITTRSRTCGPRGDAHSGGWSLVLI
jgi:hypothetical protein